MMVNGYEINTGILRTTDKCAGCNKCISACPIFSANVATTEDNISRIYIDQKRCILCGKCMDMCTHDAREFADDTPRFFDDLQALKAGTQQTPISLVVAPSFRINYPQKYRMIFGYLKSLGVNEIYNVSAGADITIWGYINHLNSHGGHGLISQPCPAVVNYIEMYKPQLIDRLIPVQSPLMCTAIYLRKYLGISDRLAFISPCIAKKYEIDRPANRGLVNYNVTYEHLLASLGAEDLASYYADESSLDYGLGALFPTQGGLRENVEYYLGLDKGKYINQKEGEQHAYSYLDMYAANVDYDDPYRARLIDTLNCARGCNYGTATEFKHTASNHIPYFTNLTRVEQEASAPAGASDPAETHAERLAALNRRFAHLNLADFMTQYEDRHVREPSFSRSDRLRIYKKLLKYDEASQHIDCNSCGYRSCEEMSTAIGMGYNLVDNCVDYVKKKLVIEHSESVLRQQKIAMLQSGKSTLNQAYIDQLTGLSNRSGYEEAIENALKRARKMSRMGYVFSIDLDDFMAINESYGHSCGNSLLVAFSSFLRSSFGEMAGVFRIGGDEFSLLLEDADEAMAQGVISKLIERAQQAWHVMGLTLYCTVSVGLVRFPEVDDGVNDIVKNADLAMVKAKQQGKNNCVIYNREFDKDSHAQFQLLRQMRDAVAQDNKGFEVHYQPWVSPERKIIGVEALMRWKNDAGVAISPGEFIPVAENAGLIIPLGEFVMRTAALTCKKINETRPDFCVSINVSVKQFSKPDFCESALSLLEETGVNLRNIVLEITESLGIENVARQKAILGRFVERGIRIAMDDFGTGYSSLSYLNQLPLTLVKIDRTFIRNIESDSFSKHLLQTMSDLMHNTGRMVCVEGVETESQLAHCRRASVDIIQGFYYFRPMPVDALEAVLAEDVW